MNPSPRIHRPAARSYESNYSSTPTIPQSTALWKAMRHREEIERRQADGVAQGGVFAHLREAVANWPIFRNRG